eukprot:g1205.t1
MDFGLLISQNLSKYEALHGKGGTVIAQIRNSPGPTVDPSVRCFDGAFREHRPALISRHPRFLTTLVRTSLDPFETGCNARLGLTDKGEVFPGTECRVLTAQANSENDLNQVTGQVVDKLVELVKSVGSSEACGSDGELKLRALVPRGAVGSIIGKGGAAIKQLRENTGAKISIGGRSETEVFGVKNAEQVISVSGTAEGLRAVLTEVNHQIQLLVAESWFSTWASSQGTVKAMGNGLASPLQMPNPLLAGQNSGIATMMQVAQGMPSYVMEDSRGFALSCVEDLELTVISEMPGEIKVPKTLEKECYPKDLKEKMEKEKTRSTSPDQKTLQEPTGRADSRTAEQVEQLETGLAKCVADFRAQAEEVLMQHLDSLEEIQQSHDFEVANLMAENMLLREKLGLKSTEHVQSMMFQNIVPEPKKKAGRGNRAHAFRDDEDDKDRERKDAKKNAIPDPSALPPPAGHGGAGGGRGTVRKGGKNQPQGSWQAFMAWVPLSSSMQQAEPWKPLPQGEIAASGQSQKSSRQVMKRREPSGEPTAILPGTPDERPHKKGEDRWT